MTRPRVRFNNRRCRRRHRCCRLRGRRRRRWCAHCWTLGAMALDISGTPAPAPGGGDIFSGASAGGDLFGSGSWPAAGGGVFGPIFDEPVATSAAAEDVAQEEVVTATSNLLIRLTQELLDSISNQNFGRYQVLCHPSLTCFEPEACGNLIHGLRFHKHYFDLKPVSNAILLAAACNHKTACRVQQSLRTCILAMPLLS